MPARRIALVLTLGGLLAAQACLAQNSETGTQRCIQLNRIDRTDVVSDSTILFYLKDGTIYRNTLPHRCPDLKSRDRFMYRVTLPELCDVDVITVLNVIGPGFMPGASCGLGKFERISKAQAEELKTVAKRNAGADGK